MIRPAKMHVLALTKLGSTCLKPTEKRTTSTARIEPSNIADIIFNLRHGPSLGISNGSGHVIKFHFPKWPWPAVSMIMKVKLKQRDNRKKQMKFVCKFKDFIIKPWDLVRFNC